MTEDPKPPPPPPPAPPPVTVSMEALRDGTYDGKAFETGDVIEVAEQYVETMEHLGLAARQDRKERAAKARGARKTPPA